MVYGLKNKKRNFILTCIVLISASLSLPVFSKSQFSAKEVINKVYQEVKNSEKKLSEQEKGKVADYIPELAAANPEYFAISIANINGGIESIGDFNVPFSIQSISKPFIYGLALKDHQNNSKFSVDDRVGLNATGHAFNSIVSITEKEDHKQNPMVNAGAIQVTSYLKEGAERDKWKHALNYMNSLSDGKAFLGEKVYRSESATNQNNQKIANMLFDFKMIDENPMDALDRYTKACSIMVTTKQLALMGATLANGGLNPVSKKRILSNSQVINILSQMVVSGLYENSGAWWTEVGLPTKSGVAGGLLAVYPHKYAIAVFSPRLDKAGNSVRGQAVIKKISQMYNLHLLH
ncbi:glutaminase A [Fluviispira sanaruensis]|uniref:Glutaminase n=1 Tax=Fluviispira sanaruensis TaxID=2493639 RepID=A0A4P2VIB8_FLUSA|nr:glutaminase A [Fluviispira sanaruensis]BBH52491.1 glutaminase A [Fluviispira sanaruensis]